MAYIEFRVLGLQQGLGFRMRGKAVIQRRFRVSPFTGSPGSGGPPRRKDEMFIENAGRTTDFVFSNL
jgi:hypothetical protein